MKKLLLLLPILFGACSTVTPPLPDIPLAAPKVISFQDILSLPMQNVKMIKENLRPGEGIGVMAGTFGPINKVLPEVLAATNAPMFRIHLGGFCNHGSRCTEGECSPGNINCIRSRARTAEKIAKSFPNSQCYASPYAEYSSTDRNRVEGWFAAIKSEAPSCIPVASAFGGYIPPSIKYIERHGNNPQISEITSNDGSNYFDSDSVKYNKKATKLSGKWTNRYNLRLTSEKSAPPPPKDRPLTNRIEKHDFILMQLMADDLSPQPATPAICSSLTKLTGEELYKPHSEDYGAANGNRGNRPMLILKSRVSKLDLLDRTGKTIGCFAYYGTFTTPGYHRYYMGTCSGQNALDLYRKTGEWGFLKNGNRCTAITVIRRMNYFRD